MSDLRDQVARAIDDLIVTVCEGGVDEVADAALAVAEPIIRKRVIEALAERTILPDDYVTEQNELRLADWLRAQGGEQ